ncbi:molybdenum cofactor guanylyltransferase, partial [bacterium]
MDLRDATLVVLAGGLGRRMGGPKSGLTYGGMPALAW